MWPQILQMTLRILGPDLHDLYLTQNVLMVSPIPRCSCRRGLPRLALSQSNRSCTWRVQCVFHQRIGRWLQRPTDRVSCPGVTSEWHINKKPANILIGFNFMRYSRTSSSLLIFTGAILIAVRFPGLLSFAIPAGSSHSTVLFLHRKRWKWLAPTLHNDLDVGSLRMKNNFQIGSRWYKCLFECAGHLSVFVSALPGFKQQWWEFWMGFF